MGRSVLVRLSRWTTAMLLPIASSAPEVGDGTFVPRERRNAMNSSRRIDREIASRIGTNETNWR